CRKLQRNVSGTENEKKNTGRAIMSTLYLERLCEVASTGNLAARLKDGGLKDRTSGTIFARDWPLVFPSRPTSARLETAAGSRRCCAGRPSHGRQRARREGLVEACAASAFLGCGRAFPLGSFRRLGE